MSYKITLQEQFIYDAALVAKLPKRMRELLALELHQLFNPPGYNFEKHDLS